MLERADDGHFDVEWDLQILAQRNDIDVEQARISLMGQTLENTKPVVGLQCQKTQTKCHTQKKVEWPSQATAAKGTNQTHLESCRELRQHV